MCKHLRRSLPYLQVLQQGFKSKTQQVETLKKFPNFVLEDIVEILYNVVNNNCKIPHSALHKSKQLIHHKTNVINLLDKAKRNKKTLKRYFNKQKGGFLATLLPIILSVLTNALTQE